MANGGAVGGLVLVPGFQHIINGFVGFFLLRF
jgi:hypothetical protein